MNLIKAIENEQIVEGIEKYNIGDTVKVYFKIIEGKTERIQIFEGLCITKKRDGLRKTFTLRKISYGVGVERIFPINSPKIQKIEVVRYGRVRRAKLYYMRDRIGKAAKVPELIRKKVIKPVKSDKTGEKKLIKKTVKSDKTGEKLTTKPGKGDKTGEKLNKKNG